MVQILKLKMFDKDVKLALTSNTVTKGSIKSAFLLCNEAIVSLSYSLDDDQVFCLTQEFPEPCFVLPNDWATMQFKVESDRVPSRPSTPADQNPNQKQKLDPNLEQLPIDGDLAANVARFAFYYDVKGDNYKRCAIPLTPRLAATFRHGENKAFKEDDEIVIRSWADNEFKVATRVVKILEEFDTIILQSEGVDICNRNFVSESPEPRKGMHYLMVGYSIRHNKTNHLSLTNGMIASDIRRRECYTGTSGYFKGDSGGGCWDVDGRLIGMQVAVEKVAHTSDNGRPASPAVGGRCLIVPAIALRIIIRDLMPQEDSDGGAEWNE